MKKKNALLFLALIALGLFSPMIAKSDILGGWEEDKGSFISNSFSSNTMNMRANPRHAGRAETTKAGGNSYKRARGWTTWPRTRHYTVAHLEDWGRINGTSGRVWGVLVEQKPFLHGELLRETMVLRVPQKLTMEDNLTCFIL